MEFRCAVNRHDEDIEAISDDDDLDMDDEEYDEQGVPEEELAYSVTAEEATEDALAGAYDEGNVRVYLANRPMKHQIQHVPTSINCIVLSDSSGQSGITMYRVPTEYGDTWLQEGNNPNLSNMALRFNAAR